MTKNKYKKIHSGSKSGYNSIPISGNSFNFYSRSNCAWAWTVTGSKRRFWTIK